MEDAAGDIKVMSTILYDKKQKKKGNNSNTSVKNIITTYSPNLLLLN
jgi:hypothetical protein